MDKPLDELYFIWLYNQVGDPEVTDPSRTYWWMLKQLFTKEFVWFIPNDDNRAEDGRDLRHEFAEQKRIKNVDPDWIRLGCSMLELLIALSRRLSFQAEGEPRDWFWKLIKNLGLQSFNDYKYQIRLPEERIDDILNCVIWRTYQYDGHGGLFPLKNAKRDQRKIELWYQLSAYILEKA